VSNPKYPVAVNDEERIQTLHDLKILDTSAEEDFDRITQCMSLIFDIPTALVSLVDTDRQWFKSRQCLSAQETERDVAFCNYTIVQDDIFEITNAQGDERFKDNPLVSGELGLRYYAGAPIIVRGHAIGSLCMLDYKVRAPLTQDQRIILTNLANIVARLINDRRLLRESTALISEMMIGR
jgi:GAF domain-containing protein